jgi:hypothetical protein
MAEVYDKFTGLEKKFSGIVTEFTQFYEENGDDLEEVLQDFEPDDRENALANMPDSVKILALQDWPPKWAQAHLSSLEPLPRAVLFDKLSCKAQLAILEASTDSQDEQVQPKKDEIDSLSESGAQEKRGQNEEYEEWKDTRPAEKSKAYSKATRDTPKISYKMQLLSGPKKNFEGYSGSEYKDSSNEGSGSENSKEYSGSEYEENDGEEADGSGDSEDEVVTV